MLKGIVVPTVHLAGKVGQVEPPPSAPIYDALYFLEEQGNNPIEFNHTVANQPNRLLLYLCGIRDNVQITGATFNGDALTKLTHREMDIQASYMRAEIWYLLAPDVGTHQVAVTSTNNDQVKFSHTVSLYNVNQAAPLKTPSSDQGSGTSSALAAVASDIYSLAIDVVSRRDGGTPTPDGAQTLRRSYSGGNLHGGVSTKPGAATSVAMSWTGSNQPWVQIGVAVNGN